MIGTIVGSVTRGAVNVIRPSGVVPTLWSPARTSSIATGSPSSSRQSPSAGSTMVPHDATENVRGSAPARRFGAWLSPSGRTSTSTRAVSLPAPLVIV